ncbi:MAG: sigma-70 family RNA polymerase sigma factor [Chitinophagaceae bacterium]|nr:sigma-70 family RNA polymerase sigma factor [Chitinophagaceae bacterium]
MTPMEDDLQIFYNLHRTYYGHLAHIGLRLGWNQEDIKDIINQMFLDLIDQGIQPDAIINPKAYLSTIFRRRLIDAIRKNNKTRQIHDYLMREEEYASGADEALEQEQQNAEIIRKIKAVYDKLPPRCQKVIFYKFYEGLTTEQIAEKTGLSQRSIYNNLFEGIKLLRAGLSAGKHFNTLSLFPLLLFLQEFS